MVAIKQKQYKEGESDSSRAIELDPQNIKAWQRRGSCRKELGMFLDAAQDFEDALRWVNGAWWLLFLLFTLWVWQCLFQKKGSLIARLIPSICREAVCGRYTLCPYGRLPRTAWFRIQIECSYIKTVLLLWPWVHQQHALKLIISSNSTLASHDSWLPLNWWLSKVNRESPCLDYYNTFFMRTKERVAHIALWSQIL